MSTEETRRIYVTKYALTSGVFTEVCTRAPADKGVVYWRGLSRGMGSHPGFYREGTDAFLTGEEALADVQKKARARVKGLKAALKKMEAVVAHGPGQIVHKEDPRPAPKNEYGPGYMQGRGAS